MGYKRVFRYTLSGFFLEEEPFEYTNSSEHIDFDINQEDILKTLNHDRTPLLILEPTILNYHISILRESLDNPPPLY